MQFYTYSFLENQTHLTNYLNYVLVGSISVVTTGWLSVFAALFITMILRYCSFSWCW